MVVRLSKTGKIVVGIIAILFVSIISIFVFKNVDFKKKDTLEDTRKLVNQDYTMYVKINPLIKFTFNEKYFECTDGKTGKKKVCSDVENMVLKYTLLNDDAKRVWKSVDIEDKTVEESLVILINVAKENNIDIGIMSLVSDYEFKENELLADLKKEINYDLKLEFDYQADIKEDDIIKILEGQAKKLTVTFDSKGGSDVTKQMVIENGTISKPKNPERKDYSFVYWTLNGKEFNFDTKIVENITLEAKWEKAKTESSKTQDTSVDALVAPVLKNVTLDTMEHEGHPRLVSLENGVYQYDLGIDKSQYRTDKNDLSKYSVVGYVIQEKLDGPLNRIIIDSAMTGAETALVTVEPGERKEFVAKVYVTDKNGKKVYSQLSNVLVIDHTKFNVPTLRNDTIQQMENNGGVKPIELVGCKYSYDLAIDKTPYRTNKSFPFKYSVSGYTISEKKGNATVGIKSPFMAEDDIVVVEVEPGEKKEFVANVFANAKSGGVFKSDLSNVITIDHSKPSAPTLRNVSGDGPSEYEEFDLGIDKSAYRASQYDYSKYSVTGYALYEKVGSSYNVVRDDILMNGAETIAVSVPSGQTKEFVARSYAVNCSGTKIYSNYSNIITISN